MKKPKPPKKFKPHGNRRKVFPGAHIPNTDHLNIHKLVTNLDSIKSKDILSIFSEPKDHFREQNYKHGKALQSLFKNNVLFLCDLNRLGMNDFFNCTKQMGITGSYQAFLNGNRTPFYCLLYLAMFSRIFGIEAGILLSVNLRDEYFKLNRKLAPKSWLERNPE